MVCASIRVSLSKCLKGSAEMSCMFRGIKVIGGFVFRRKGPQPSSRGVDEMFLFVLLDVCLEVVRLIVRDVGSTVVAL
jgi:hypothetical protein